MDKREYLLFRVATKCGDFARNLSFHRVLGDYVNDSEKRNFWIHMYNNAIELAILDWSHLFGNHKDDLHWKRVVHDPVSFKRQFLKAIRMTEQEWSAYHREIKSYRDKDIAHIEVRLKSHVPDMTQALQAAACYYSVVLNELQNYGIYDYPQDLNDYHEKSVAQTAIIAGNAYKATIGIKEKVY
ncbi:MAG: hypothetical protein ABSB94_00480 [Syntrophorhabdales bacterium]|jgi:hypothetical protein